MEGLASTPEAFPELPASDELWDLFRLCWRFAAEKSPTTETTLWRLFDTLRQGIGGQTSDRLHRARYLVRFLGQVELHSYITNETGSFKLICSGLRVADLTDRISKMGRSTSAIASGFSDVYCGKLLPDGHVVCV